ncbi:MULTISPECIES: DNA-binding protein [unclassified Agrococcus]|uniref:DNA-binding protein n=1 Tax=unclassified Agrococcus TaxID=2615065 RepID=UPI00361B75F5
MLTIDRRGSRTHADDVDETRAALERRWGRALRSPIARFAGDELQLVSTDPVASVRMVLDLARSRDWSVGVGIGVATLASDPAASTGPAFFAARRAVDRAKHAPGRVAVEVDDDALALGADDLEAVLWLLVALRDRRTKEGWEVADLLERLATQREVADELGISASAVSARAVAAGIRVESAGVATVEGMLARLVGGRDA